MKKRINSTIPLTLAACCIPFILSFVFYNRLPSQLGIHANILGETNRYASKVLVAFGLPAAFFAYQIYMLIKLHNDPRRDNIAPFLFHLRQWLIPIVSNALELILVVNVVTLQLQFVRYTLCAVGFLFVIMGNYLPKTRQNYAIGIRLPWTLHDEENWRKTNRLAGYTWAILGLAASVSAMVLPSPFFLWALFAVMFVVPFIYSFILYSKEKQNISRE